MPAWVQTPRSGQTWGQSILGSWLLTPRECTLSHSEGSGLNLEPESRRQVWLWGQQRLDLISSGIKKKREREKECSSHYDYSLATHWTCREFKSGSNWIQSLPCQVECIINELPSVHQGDHLQKEKGGEGQFTDVSVYKDPKYEDTYSALQQ